MRRALFLLVMVTALVTACEQSFVEPDPETMGYDYYPLEIGSYRVYNVTDIRFKADVGDTTRFQMRERIDTTFIDQTEALNYKIVRSIRANESQKWVDDSVITVIKTNTSLVLSQNNTKFIKLVFPVKEEKSWSGNAFNTYTNPTREHPSFGHKEPYTYANVGDSFAVNENTFDNTITVIQGYPTKDPTMLDDRKEVYAKGVGPVYRQYTRIVYTPCNDDVCEYGPEYKIYGQERHEELISHGIE